MSRSGYNSDDSCDYGSWEYIMYRGAVASATKGKRGQKLFLELAAAMDAMPEKKLIAGDLASDEGVCAIGCVGKARGIDMTGIDPYDREQVAKTFGIAPALASEIAWANDEGTYRNETPEERWTRMRKWVADQITKIPTPP